MRFPLERLRVPCRLARCWGPSPGWAPEFRAWGRPRAGPRGLPALLLGPDGLLCVSNHHPSPAAFMSSPLSCLGSELSRTEAGLLAGLSQAAPQGPARAGASLQGAHLAAGKPSLERLAVFSQGVSRRYVRSLTPSAWLSRFRHSPSQRALTLGSAPAQDTTLSRLRSPRRPRAPLQTLWQVLQPGGVHVSEGRAGWLGAGAPLTAPCPQVQVRALPVPQRDAARADLPLERLQRDPRVSGVRPRPRGQRARPRLTLCPSAASGMSGRSPTTPSGACGCAVFWEAHSMFIRIDMEKSMKKLNCM